MIDGSILIGASARQANRRFHSVNPSSGEQLLTDYSQADGTDVNEACELANSVAHQFSALAPSKRADLLEKIGAAIADIGDELIETAMKESGLPQTRLQGERGRTLGQLQLFADELRLGKWLDVTIDLAMPDRTPPRSDLRRMNLALGPVAVFGASNFPLAFSVAGGDTASALAAGCPVVVKGHPAHPGTGELVARAVLSAAAATGMPDGVFSYLPGSQHGLGSALVSHPAIRAVAFTGSRAGGLALAGVAAKRETPIPVYAEMSSVNPVILMPAALAARPEVLGEAFVGSLTLGAGQFCTNPGIVIVLDGPSLDSFLAAAGDALGSSEPAVMLTPDIHGGYDKRVAKLETKSSANKVAVGKESDLPNRCRGAIFTVTAGDYIADRDLSAEVFGASSVVVRCKDMGELSTVVESLEGQLTATLHFDKDDEQDVSNIMPILAEKAGRILANGWPTGVEVCHAMVHGGPYPATTDSRTTSVGSLAMTRFLRPVCFQDLSDGLLPPALQSDNPWLLPRRVDGKWDFPA